MRFVPFGVAGGLILSASLVFVAAPASAATPVTDFDYTLSGSTATITNYVGTATDVEIPAAITVNGVSYAVTAIGDNAFRGNYTGVLLTSIVIPDSVVSIGANSFRGDLLSSVVVPDSVLTIGTYAFYNNLIATATLGDAVTTIGNNAFRGNYLTSLSIPASVTNIGNNSFADNTTLANTLTSVIFAGSAPTLGAAAFFTGPGPILYYYAGATGFSAAWDGYTVREISAADSGLTLVPAAPIVADGATSATLTVTVRDNTQAPVGGVPVAFTVPAGVSASTAACTSAADGTCAISLASTRAATYVVSAKIGSDPALLTQSITFDALPGTTVAAPPASGVRSLPVTGIDLRDPLLIALVALVLGISTLGALGIRRRATHRAREN